MQNKIHETERVLKALANRRRLLIVKFLASKGSASVSDIAGEIRLSFAATSRHLRVLASADVVDFEQAGTVVNYSLHAAHHPVLDAALRSAK